MIDTSKASREILWNLSSPINQIVMYSMFAFSMVVLVWALWQRILLWKSGAPDNTRTSSLGDRFAILFDTLVTQRTVNEKKEPRIFHTLIYWGFIVLLFTTTMVFIDHDLGIKIYQGRFYLAVTLLSDLFGLGLLLGIFYAAYRRYFLKPDYLHNTRQDLLMLLLLGVMVVQGFMLEALRIAATKDPFAIYSPVGYLYSLFFWNISVEGLKILHFVTWWIHAITVFVFFALLPYTKFFHVIASTANLFFQNIERPKGALSNPGDIEQILEKAAESETGDFKIGISTINDLTWKQKLNLDSCTSCGRCQEVCPAYNSGKPLSPKWLILDSRNHMLALHAKAESNGNLLNMIDKSLIRDVLIEEPLAGTIVRASNQEVQNSVKSIGGSADDLLAGTVMDEDVFWSCTTCRACEEVCPVGIEHVDYIVDVRRSMTLIEGRLPTEAQNSLRAIETRGNPFGPAESRTDWTAGLEVPILKEGDEVDILYWVGCVSAYDKRKQKIATSMAKILNASGFKWGILGNNECCSGDPARRLGEENLFQTLAKKNLGTLKTVKFKTVVSNCAHCFNSLKNEYPQFGEISEDKDVQVIHHSQFIQKLLEDEVLKVEKKQLDDITFHDPCYVGRYNDTYEEPREALIQIGGNLKEMKDNKKTGMCCGAGGGHFWMDMKKGERINTQRVEQAAETSAKTIATGCPFCMQMLEDGVKLTERENSLEVKDIAELVADAILTRHPEA